MLRIRGKISCAPQFFHLRGDRGFAFLSSATERTWRLPYHVVHTSTRRAVIQRVIRDPSRRILSSKYRCSRYPGGIIRESRLRGNEVQTRLRGAREILQNHLARARARSVTWREHYLATVRYIKNAARFLLEIKGVSLR